MSRTTIPRRTKAPARYETPATTDRAATPLDPDEGWCEALFASALQPSDSPTAEMIAEAISRTVRRLGAGRCVSRMAQEFGDHPEAAANRMCWVRQLARAASAAPPIAA
jgi:hypothetical protein